MSRRRPNPTAEDVAAIRAELDEALVGLARKHRLSVPYLIRLAQLGGSAQA